MKDIFISYATEDYLRVADLVRKLNDAGFSTWLDKADLKPGQQWELEIERAIRDCRIFIACLSNSAINKRGHVQSELKQAMKAWERVPEGQVFMVPVRLEECDIPHSLEKFHCADMFQGNGTTLLIESLRRILDATHAPPRSALTGLEFNLIKIHHTDTYWIERKLPNNNRLAEIEYSQFFSMTDLVNDADLILDVTLYNSHDHPLILTHFGIEFCYISHIGYIYGIPVAGKIISTDSHRVEMPNLFTAFYSQESSVMIIGNNNLSEEDKKHLMQLHYWESQEASPFSDGMAEMTIRPMKVKQEATYVCDDPIYFQAKSPYRTTIRLCNFAKNIPNHALFRLTAKTKDSIALSHVLRTFTT